MKIICTKNQKNLLTDLIVNAGFDECQELLDVSETECCEMSCSKCLKNNITWEITDETPEKPLTWEEAINMIGKTVIRKGGPLSSDDEEETMITGYAVTERGSYVMLDNSGKFWFTCDGVLDDSKLYKVETEE